MFFFLLHISIKEIQEKVDNLEKEITMKQKELHRIREQLDSAKVFDQDLKNRINFIENSKIPYPPQAVIENELIAVNADSVDKFNSYFNKPVFSIHSFEASFQSRNPGQYSSIYFSKPQNLNCYPSEFDIYAVLSKENQIKFKKVYRNGEFYPELNFPFPIQFSQIKITSIKSNNNTVCFPKITAKGFK